MAEHKTPGTEHRGAVPRDTYAPWVELTLARMREFLREKGAVFWAFGFPVLLSLGLGLAFRERSAPVPRVGVASHAEWLDEALDKLKGEGKLEVLAQSADRLERGLRIGSVDLLLAPGADASAEGGRRVEYTFDPDREEARSARLVVDDLLQREFGRLDAALAKDLPYRSRTRYIDFLFPGMIGMTLMGSCMWGLGFNIVLMRKRKQLKRLAATPMRRMAFLQGMFLSRATFLAAEVLSLLLFGWLLFGIHVEGSSLGVLLMALLGSLAFSGLALMITARIESVEAANGWINVVTMPMWIFSGIFFSYERFPEVLHKPLSLLPLSALNDGLRAVINEGRPLPETWPQVAILGTWALVGFLVAGRRFRWQ